MKVLWLCNIMLPIIAEHLGERANVFGGWLTGALSKLLTVDNMEINVIVPSNKIFDGQVNSKLKYFSFIDDWLPDANDNDMINRFKYILETVRPDIIHVWGTEYKHSYNMIDACERAGVIDKAVIDIQGLVSICAKHYNAYLPNKIVKAKSFRDFIRGGGVESGRRDFERRGVYEEAVIKKVKHVMGRTDWDYACVKRLNPSVNYHHVNETLRDAFYNSQWQINNCERNSIFASSSSYPLKGFHIMLEAMADIIKFFPDAKLYTTGNNPLTANFHDKIRQTAYTKYIIKLIKDYKLEDHVIFTGFLNEAEMCERYLKSHVFVSPSSIENSSNSICEAMILGVPGVSSDVGGIKSLMTHNEEGLIYQADAFYMLARSIINIFEDDGLAQKFSHNARAHALKTHDKDLNLKALIDAYNKIAEEI